MLGDESGYDHLIQAARGKDAVPRHGHGRHAWAGRIKGDDLLRRVDHCRRRRRNQSVTKILQLSFFCRCRQGKGKNGERYQGPSECMQDNHGRGDVKPH